MHSGCMSSACTCADNLRLFLYLVLIFL